MTKCNRCHREATCVVKAKQGPYEIEGPMCEIHAPIVLDALQAKGWRPERADLEGREVAES